MPMWWNVYTVVLETTALKQGVKVRILSSVLYLPGSPSGMALHLHCRIMAGSIPPLGTNLNNDVLYGSELANHSIR